MFNQYNEPTNYMTLDSSTLNPYNYKNMDDKLSTYQQYQNFYYYTRQINPISLANVSPESRDPSNLPCNVRPTIYDGVAGVYGENSMNDIMKLQTNLNNQNKWQDNVPAKTGYYTQHEHTNNFYRPISAIQAGQATSNHDFHGYLLF
jgi:hypothetical protein